MLQASVVSSPCKARHFSCLIYSHQASSYKPFFLSKQPQDTPKKVEFDITALSANRITQGSFFIIFISIRSLVRQM